MPNPCPTTPATCLCPHPQVHAHNLAVARGGPDAPTHCLRLNRFADWSKDEFDRVMLPKKWAREHGMLKDDKVRRG